MKQIFKFPTIMVSDNFTLQKPITDSNLSNKMHWSIGILFKFPSELGHDYPKILSLLLKGYSPYIS